MRLIALGLLAASVGLSGCAGSSPPPGDDPPGVRSAALPGSGGGLMVTPATTTPGQRVALRFASEQVRGIAFSLSTRSEEGWTVAYYLTSDWGSPGNHHPGWWSVEDSEGRGWVDIGIAGPGPDHVIVPDDAPAGEYLLCTANSADEACALLTVEDQVSTRR